MSETIQTSDVTTSTEAPSSSVTETSGAPATSVPADSQTPASSTGTDATTAPSSGDSRQSDREGLLAAVRSVVDKTPKPTSEGETAEGDVAGDKSGDKDAATGASGTTERKDETPTADLPDPTEGELRKLRPETRRRFEQLLRQRNESRQEIERLQPEVTQYRDLMGRIQTAQLAPEDFNQLLFIGSSLRQEKYQEFLEAVTPYVMAAQQALGLRIAPDLQNQVNDGTLSEEAAREFTRTRFRAAQAEARLKDTTVAHTTERQTAAINEIRAGVTAWEQSIRARDPDYAQKADTVRRFSQSLLTERGTPQNPQQAVALVQAAYDEANKVFSVARPPPRPTRPSPSSVHVATGGGAPNGQTPNSLREAVLLGIERSRRASQF